MSYKLFIGYLIPIYCALLLAGCAYFSHSKWPQGEAKLADIPPLPNIKLNTVAAPDFAKVKPAKKRKQVFFEFFLPLIRAENERQIATRQTFEALRARTSQNPDALSTKELNLLSKLSESYKIANDLPHAEQFQILAYRIGPIPEALAMAQAATESAWGKSRFAREGNNFFGQWCFSPGCGMVPRSRNEGASHEVAKFVSPAHSVRAYFENINTFSAYQELREIRADLVNQNKPVKAEDLLAGLTQYSEKGEAYLTQIETIIRQNNLSNL